MSIHTPATSEPVDHLPVRQNAGEAWDKICRMMGLPLPVVRDPADLPPWPEEDATAFERAINEAFERVEEPKQPPL